MPLTRIAAFAVDDATGGNPAGDHLSDTLPPAADMQRIAAEVGFSETAFAARDGDAWTTRYFAPEAEVPFCGHATIALGAQLGASYGAGRYRLNLSDGSIDVTARQDGAHWAAELTSPPTTSAPLDRDVQHAILDLFGWTDADLDPRIAPSLTQAGATHALLALRDRATLAAMSYDFDAGQRLMRDHGLVTINTIQIEAETLIHSRNAFAFGGVVEDPATGAAAAALGGALVDLGWPALRGGGRFRVHQGDDMGAPSRLTVAVTGTAGDGVRVSGITRTI